MIEKITLNDAIINEDIVSAISGKLPIASETKNGIISAGKYRYLPKLLTFDRTFQMYRLCHHDVPWQSYSILFFGALDKNISVAQYVFFTEDLSDEGIANNSTKSIIAGSMDRFAFYVKDGYTFIRIENGNWNGGLFVTGNVNSFLNMGIITNVSGYRKMNI